MGLIGSAIGAAGSIFGGIKASKAMKKAKRNVEAQRKKNQDWHDRRYNEDATQRADATSQIAADAEARKDNIEATYMQNDNALVEQLNAIEQGKANAISGAVQGVTNAVSQMPF